MFTEEEMRHILEEALALTQTVQVTDLLIEISLLRRELQATLYGKRSLQPATSLSCEYFANELKNTITMFKKRGFFPTAN